MRLSLPVLCIELQKLSTLRPYDHLFVAVDKDGTGATGQHAADSVSRLWLNAGKRVSHVHPLSTSPRADINDIVRDIGGPVCGSNYEIEKVEQPPPEGPVDTTPHVGVGEGGNEGAKEGTKNAVEGGPGTERFARRRKWPPLGELVPLPDPTGEIEPVMRLLDERLSTDAIEPPMRSIDEKACESSV